MNALPPGWGKNQQPTFKTSLPLATQLFPVGDMLSKDYRDTLGRVKESGYDGVEFYGGLRYVAQEMCLACTAWARGHRPCKTSYPRP